MSSFASVAETLTDSLHLSEPPIAICFTDSVPAGVQTFSGSVPAGCRFWQEAAKQVFATQANQHDLCSIGIYTHNLEMAPGVETDLGDALKVFFGDLGYVRPEDIPQIPVLKQKARVIVYGPLADVPLPPDVVLLFVRADQSFIISEPTQQNENGQPPAMGRTASANVPQAFNTGPDCAKPGLLRSLARIWTCWDAGCRAVCHPGCRRSKPSPRESRRCQKPMVSSHGSIPRDAPLWRAVSTPP